MGSPRSVGRRIVSALASVLVALAMVGPFPATAAAPPPPLDPCLSGGSFLLGDPACRPYEPEVGNNFGRIAGIEVLTVERGQPVNLSAPNGASIDFDPPPNQVCGERGCPRTFVMWRRGFSFHHGIGFTEGCTGFEITCTVVYAPPLIGDTGEEYQAVFAEEYLGWTPTGNSRMFLLYTPPTVYPVRVDAVDTSGAGVRIPTDFVAYAVREGTDPTQADCDTTDWVQAALASATFPIPDCTTLARSGDRFSGLLPNDSGTWTVVGAPHGDAGAPLLSRPSPYRRTTITPRNDDIVATIVAERRPGLAMEVRPEMTVMNLGTTQVVNVIVAAQGGETGALERLTFEDAGVLALTGEDAALEIVGISEEAPTTGFSLGVGEQRALSVEVRAVGLGEGAVRAAVGGADDLGQALRVEQGGPILVEYAEVDGAEAPPAPVIVRALDGGEAGPDVIEGTVDGSPDTTVTVSLAASPVGGDETCSQLMSGDGVIGLGSFPVTIDTDGVGRFTHDRALSPGTYVYGITVVGPAVSDVGECTRVSEVTPSVSIEDAEVAEGSGKGGPTALTFTVRLSGPSETPLSVVVASSDGSATAPGDYEPLSPTTISFAPGETTATVAIDVVRDKAEEPDEDLTVTLSSPVGAAIATSMATGNIVNDDGGAGGNTSGELDLRGRWEFVPIPAVRGSSAWIDVKTWDAASGRLTGSMTVEYRGKAFVERLTGTLKAARLTLAWQSGKGSGTLVTRDGKPSFTITGVDADGDTLKGRMTLTEPRGSK